MSFDVSTPSKILCCLCGVLTEPNNFNTCLNCLKHQVNITEGIPKKAQLSQCPKCQRYLQPPSRWITAAPESKELISICLRKLPSLSKLHLVDANFVWTESHSKRILVRLTVRKQVLEKEMLQQTFVVEFTVLSQICDECQRAEAKDFWKSSVQIRQRVDHKRTIFYLEQVLLKKGIHRDASSVEVKDNGLDFFFSSETAARKFVNTIDDLIPMRHSMSKSLISHDTHSNSYNYKYVFSVDVVPLCKDCIVCLPNSVRSKFAGIGPICICYKVTRMIYLIDPNTMQTAVISSSEYFRNPFNVLCSVHQMRAFLVMESTFVNERKEDRHKRQNSPRSTRKFAHSECWVLRDEDTFSSSEQQLFCRTHLGNLLNAGDVVLGYDLERLNPNDESFDQLDRSEHDLPTTILVRKIYPDQPKKKRKWRLARLVGDQKPSETDDKQFDDFMGDVEEDLELRKAINIYADDPGSENRMLDITELTAMFDDMDMVD